MNNDILVVLETYLSSFLLVLCKRSTLCEYFSDCYNAFFLLQSNKTYFYSRGKAFLRLWHDRFTFVEKHFYNRKNKFCCL